jgi:hypothetical protein
MDTKLWLKKLEGEISLGRPRRRWKDNIQTDRKEIVWEGVNWIHLAQDRDRWRAVVNTAMEL